MGKGEQHLAALCSLAGKVTMYLVHWSWIADGTVYVKSLTMSSAYKYCESSVIIACLILF